MIKLDLPEVKSLAVEAIKEKGVDYVYVNPNGEKIADGTFVNCFNWHHTPDGGRVPGCIVGNILHRAGISLDDMPHDLNVQGSLEALKDLAMVSREGVIALKYMQWEQDNGATWGAAFEKAFGVPFES